MLSIVYVKKYLQKPAVNDLVKKQRNTTNRQIIPNFPNVFLLPAGRLEIQGELDHIIGITVRILIPGLL